MTLAEFASKYKESSNKTLDKRDEKKKSASGRLWCNVSLRLKRYSSNYKVPSVVCEEATFTVLSFPVTFVLSLER